MGWRMLGFRGMGTADLSSRTQIARRPYCVRPAQEGTFNVGPPLAKVSWSAKETHGTHHRNSNLWLGKVGSSPHHSSLQTSPHVYFSIQKYRVIQYTIIPLQCLYAYYISGTKFHKKIFY